MREKTERNTAEKTPSFYRIAKPVGAAACLLLILVISAQIRLKGLSNLPDGQFIANDAYLYYSHAETIVRDGKLPEVERHRWVPLGRDLRETLHGYPAHEIERKPPVKKKNTKLYAHQMPKPIDPQAQFYRTILENNIFAPLGWKPKTELAHYKLIGTQVPSSRKTDARAVLQETTSERTLHVVSIGTRLRADIVVADIRPKQVILKNGKQRISLTLPRIEFLR